MRLDHVGGSPQLLQTDTTRQHIKSQEGQITTGNEPIEQPLSKDKMNTLADKLNEFSVAHQLQFKLHEELNEYYVTLVNPLTNEVIKEIPPKKMLDMYAAMVEFIGILIDEKI